MMIWIAVITELTSSPFAYVMTLLDLLGKTSNLM